MCYAVQVAWERPAAMIIMHVGILWGLSVRKRKLARRDRPSIFLPSGYYSEIIYNFTSTPASFIWTPTPSQKLYLTIIRLHLYVIFIWGYHFRITVVNSKAKNLLHQHRLNFSVGQIFLCVCVQLLYTAY